MGAEVKNFFVVYNQADFPICCADKIKELEKFTGLPYDSLKSAIARIRKGKQKHIKINNEWCSIRNFKMGADE